MYTIYENSLFNSPNQFSQDISAKEREENPIAYGLLDTGLHHCNLILAIGKAGYFVGYNVAAAVGMAGGAACGALKYLKTFPRSNRTKSLRQYCIDGAINVNSSSFLKNTATIVGVLVSTVQLVALSPTLLMFNLNVLIFSALRTCLVAYDFAKKKGESHISEATDALWNNCDLIKLNKQLHDFMNNPNDKDQAKQKIHNSVAALLKSIQEIGLAYSETILSMINEIPKLAKKVLPESVVKKLEGQNVKSGLRSGEIPLLNRHIWHRRQASSYTQTSAAV